MDIINREIKTDRVKSMSAITNTLTGDVSFDIYLTQDYGDIGIYTDLTDLEFGGDVSGSSVSNNVGKTDLEKLYDINLCVELAKPIHSRTQEEIDKMVDDCVEESKPLGDSIMYSIPKEDSYVIEPAGIGDLTHYFSFTNEIVNTSGGFVPETFINKVLNDNMGSVYKWNGDNIFIEVSVTFEYVPTENSEVFFRLEMDHVNQAKFTDEVHFTADTNDGSYIKTLTVTSNLLDSSVTTIGDKFTVSLLFTSPTDTVFNEGVIYVPPRSGDHPLTVFSTVNMDVQIPDKQPSDCCTDFGFDWVNGECVEILSDPKTFDECCSELNYDCDGNGGLIVSMVNGVNGSIPSVCNSSVVQMVGDNLYVVSGNSVPQNVIITGTGKNRLSEINIYGSTVLQPGDTMTTNNGELFSVDFITHGDVTGYTITNPINNVSISYITLEDGGTTYEYGYTHDGSETCLYTNIKEDNKIGVVFQPETKSNVFIDRGVISPIESHLRLDEIVTIDDLDKNKGGFFNILE